MHCPQICDSFDENLQIPTQELLYLFKTESDKPKLTPEDSEKAEVLGDKGPRLLRFIGCCEFLPLHEGQKYFQTFKQVLECMFS